VLDGWVELEEAIAQLRLFDADLPPELSHGLRGDCGGQLMAQVAQLDRPREEGDAG
jgi:hypothetical protein